MTQSYENLREHYSQMDTDTLLNIKVSGELTDEAQLALDAELNERNVSEDDMRGADESNQILVHEREKLVNQMKRRFRRQMIIVGSIVLVSVIYYVLK